VCVRVKYTSNSVEMTTFIYELSNTTHVRRLEMDAERAKRDSVYCKEVVLVLNAAKREARSAAADGKLNARFRWTSFELQATPNYPGINTDSHFAVMLQEQLNLSFGYSKEGGKKYATIDGTYKDPKKNKRWRKNDIWIDISWPPLNPESIPASVPKPVSNVVFECPVCFETTPANILAPCGHHTCKPCFNKMQKQDVVKHCAVCKTPVAQEQQIFADRESSKRKAPEDDESEDEMLWPPHSYPRFESSKRKAPEDDESEDEMFA
jgi:hypothetical protein